LHEYCCTDVALKFIPIGEAPSLRSVHSAKHPIPSVTPRLGFGQDLSPMRLRISGLERFPALKLTACGKIFRSVGLTWKEGHNRQQSSLPMPTNESSSLFLKRYRNYILCLSPSEHGLFDFQESVIPHGVSNTPDCQDL